MNNPPICNGCGEPSSEWDKLCANCEQEVVCNGCNGTYKRGQGLCDVNMCPSCLRESLETPEEEYRRLEMNESDPHMEDAYEQFGFDHSWEN